MKHAAHAAHLQARVGERARGRPRRRRRRARLAAALALGQTHAPRALAARPKHALPRRAPRLALLPWLGPPLAAHAVMGPPLALARRAEPPLALSHGAELPLALPRGAGPALVAALRVARVAALGPEVAALAHALQTAAGIRAGVALARPATAAVLPRVLARPRLWRAPAARVRSTAFG